MSEKTKNVVEERTVKAIYEIMKKSAYIETLAVEMGVGIASARRYAKALVNSKIVVRKELGTKMKLSMSPSDCFAVLKVEKDCVRITVCLFGKKYVHSVMVLYNEALIPEHTVINCRNVLKRIAEDLCVERIFVGTVMCDRMCVEKELCEGFFSHVLLSEDECEKLALEREKERDCAFTEYFCNSVRKSRLRDVIIDSWRSMDLAERGMIDALLCYVAKKIHMGEVI